MGGLDRGDEFLGGTVWLPLIPLAVALAGLPILLRWHRARRPGRLDTLLTVVFLVAVTFALQMAAWFVQPSAIRTAGEVVLSPETTTYFAYAHGVDNLSDLLSRYTKVMPTLGGHARTHPPGPVVLFWLVQQAARVWPGPAGAMAWAADQVEPGGFDLLLTYAAGLAETPGLPASTVAAAVLSGFLLPFLGSLSVLLVYFLARLLHGPPAAVLAGFCAAAIPSLVLFAPTVDQVVALLAVAALLALCAAGLRGSPLLAALAGLVLALGVFVSLSLLALIPLGGLWLGLSRARRRLAVALACAGGFAAFFLALYAFLGFNFPGVVIEGIRAHRVETTVLFPRTYHKWVFWNLVDAALFLGLPLSLWLARDLLRQVRPGVRAAGGADALLVALLVTVLALDLSGLVRAEVGRLWMFLMVLAAVPAGAAIARAGRGAGLAAATTLAMQVVQVIVFKQVMTLFVIWA